MSLALLLLIASIVGLIVGPLLLRVREGLEAWRPALDGFALVAVAGLAALHLIPEALAEGGAAAAGCAIIGATLPFVVDRTALRKGANVSALVLLGGLIPHVALESAALGAADADHVVGLGAAVAAHRLPVGLILFAIISRQYGSKRGWGAIGGIVIFTIAGFWAGDLLAGPLTGQPFALLQAFVAGSLLHVAFSHRLDDAPLETGTADAAETGNCCAHAEEAEEAHVGPEAPLGEHSHGGGSGIAVWPVLGALAGVAVLAIALEATPAHDHGATGADFASSFTSLFLQSAPALVIAYILAGLVVALITPARAQWLGGRGRGSQALRGVAFGLPLPICSCGVLPLYETLVRRGVPATAAVAFLIATPELGLDAILLSVPLLGSELTFARVGAALLVALVVALVVGRVIGRSEQNVASEPEEETGPFSARLWKGMRFGLVELFDTTMPWILAGLLIAAWLEPVLAQASLHEVPAYLQVPLFALIGIPLYVCAAGATPIAAIAIFSGVSPGAGIAFLLSGPATNVTTFGIFSRLHGRRAAIFFGVSMTLAAICAGWAVDFVGVQFLGELQMHEHGGASWIQWGALGALGLLFAWSLLRQGPRGVVGQIRQPVSSH